jgi:hypothetical protein
MRANLLASSCLHPHLREVPSSYVGDIGCSKPHGRPFSAKIPCIRYHFLNLGGIPIEEGDWGREHGSLRIGKRSRVKVVPLDRRESYGLTPYHAVVSAIKLPDDTELRLVPSAAIANSESNTCRIISVWTKFCRVYIVLTESIGRIS